MTNENVSDAYGVIQSFELAKVQTFSTLSHNIADALDDLMADFPDSAKSSTVYQTLLQMRNIVTSNYQLATLRQQFGLDGAPVYTTPQEAPTTQP